MRWGAARSGVERMRCVTCRRTFSSTTGTAVSVIHSQAGFHQVVMDMFSDHSRSCRRLGEALGFDRMTIWRWRQRSSVSSVVRARPGWAAWSKRTRNSSGDPGKARENGSDIRAIRSNTQSRAGYAGWTPNARGHRWRPGSRISDPGPHDGGSKGVRRADCSQPLCAATYGVLSRCFRNDAVLCSDRDPAYDFFARQTGVPHYRIDAKKGPFVIDKAFHIQTINSLHDRFERFMEPFRGPATKNLTGYASWFIARSVRTEPERVEDAWDRLMAA